MGTELQRRLAAARGEDSVTENPPGENRKCTVCGEGPYPHNYMHAFTTTPNDLRDKPAPEPPKRIPPSVITTDIVLRLALVNKGVLTHDDLRAAEAQLGINTGMAVVGQPAEAVPGPDHAG